MSCQRWTETHPRPTTWTCDPQPNTWPTTQTKDTQSEHDSQTEHIARKLNTEPKQMTTQLYTEKVTRIQDCFYTNSSVIHYLVEILSLFFPCLSSSISLSLCVMLKQHTQREEKLKKDECFLCFHTLNPSCHKTHMTPSHWTDTWLKPTLR